MVRSQSPTFAVWCSCRLTTFKNWYAMLTIYSQVLAKGPRPLPGAEGCALAARVSRVHRVRLCAYLPRGRRIDELHRFFGLFGVYFSLRYLSLSDATVLTFLSPIFTGIASAIFLKEPFSRKELMAGRTYNALCVAKISLNICQCAVLLALS